MSQLVSQRRGVSGLGAGGGRRPTSLFLIATENAGNPPTSLTGSSVQLPPRGERVKLPRRYETLLHHSSRLDNASHPDNNNHTMAESGSTTSKHINTDNIASLTEPCQQSRDPADHHRRTKHSRCYGNQFNDCDRPRTDERVCHSGSYTRDAPECQQHRPAASQKPVASQVTPAGTSSTTRERDLETAVAWIRQEIHQLKDQDRDLMRQLLDLRACIRQLIGFRVLTSSRSGPDLATWTPLLEERGGGGVGGGGRPALTATSLCSPSQSPRDIAYSFQAKTVSMLAVHHGRYSPAFSLDDTPDMPQKTFVTLV